MQRAIVILLLLLTFSPVFAQPENAKPPVLLSQIRLQYPQEAEVKGIEGKVVVALLVETTGRVSEMRIQQSDNDLLNAAAMGALKDAQFTPATFDGVPERTWYLQSLTFKLSDAQKALAKQRRVLDLPPVPLEPIADYYPYPLDAKDAGVEGWVTVQMLIDTAGEVDSVEVVEASSPIFEMTSSLAMRHTKFSPAIENGRKVRAWYKQSFKFELPNKHVKMVAGLDTNITAYPVLLGETPILSSSEIVERRVTTMRVLIGSNGVPAAVIALDYNVPESIRSQITELTYRLAFAPGMIKDKVSEMWCDISYVVLPEAPKQ